jgi:hypothetical protein
VLLTGDGSEPNSNAFLNALEIAIAEGRLQEALESVDSESELIIYSGDVLPPALQPSLTNPPNPGPSDEPTRNMATTAPSESPSGSGFSMFTDFPTSPLSQSPSPSREPLSNDTDPPTLAPPVSAAPSSQPAATFTSGEPFLCLVP